MSYRKLSVCVSKSNLTVSDVVLLKSRWKGLNPCLYTTDLVLRHTLPRRRSASYTTEASCRAASYIAEASCCVIHRRGVVLRRTLPRRRAASYTAEASCCVIHCRGVVLRHTLPRRRALPKPHAFLGREHPAAVPRCGQYTGKQEN